MQDPDSRALGTPGSSMISPHDRRRDHGQGYFGNNPQSAYTVTGKQPGTPADQGSAGRVGGHRGGRHSIDGPFMGPLPPTVSGIRVIYAGGETRTVNVQDCRTADEIFRCTLRKFGLREDHIKNYYFYVLDGTAPDPARCRRISDAELVRISRDRFRSTLR